MRISDWSSTCALPILPQCNDTGEKIYQQAGFDVIATRRAAGPARTVTLPYFATVMQGGSAVVAKRLGQVQVTFAEGQVRGTGHGEASAYVDATAAKLPADIQDRNMRKRKPGDEIGRAHVRTPVNNANIVCS